MGKNQENCKLTARVLKEEKDEFYAYVVSKIKTGGKRMAS